MEDALLTKMRVQISSNTIRQLKVTTLTATMDTTFNSSITVTQSEDIKPLISTSSSPYSTTVISQHGEETIPDTGSNINVINKTFTSKTISWANWKISNMYPVSFLKSFVSPIATDISMSTTDPLFSFPGATLAPWNEIGKAQIVKGNTEFYTGAAFKKIFKCSADKVITSLIEIIVEDANTRLLSNPVTSKYSKLISD